MKRYDFVLTYKILQRSLVDPLKLEEITKEKKVRGYGNSKAEAKKYVCQRYGCKASQLSTYKEN